MSDDQGGRYDPRTVVVLRMIRAGLTVYGGFDCPWSYLASRRADLLGHEGIRVDWRAVEHSDRREARSVGTVPRLHRVRAQLDQAVTDLRPGERLPYSLTGQLPGTTAAVLAYATAYRAGVGAAIRPVLFDALWVHGLDLDDHELVHMLIKEAWPDRVRVDGEPVDREVAASATIDQPPHALRRLRQRWRDEVSAMPCDVLPVLVVDGRARLHGGHAVGWLGDEMTRRGIDPGREGADRDTTSLKGRGSASDWIAPASRATSRRGRPLTRNRGTDSSGRNQ